jgi:hypothetical protein
MFIKDCTILYTATVGAAPFFSACRNRQTCFAGADFQEIYSEIHNWRVLCSSAPSSSAHGARHPRAGTSAAARGRRGPKPLQFQIEMPFVARAQFEPS